MTLWLTLLDLSSQHGSRRPLAIWWRSDCSIFRALGTAAPTAATADSVVSTASASTVNSRKVRIKCSHFRKHRHAVPTSNESHCVANGQQIAFYLRKDMHAQPTDSLYGPRSRRQARVEVAPTLCLGIFLRRRQVLRLGRHCRPSPSSIAPVTKRESLRLAEISSS